MNVKFYRCKICGKIVAMVNETAVPTICCGQEMYELLPNTTEGAFEKHIPVVSREGNVVTVKVSRIYAPSATPIITNSPLARVMALVSFSIS